MSIRIALLFQFLFGHAALASAQTSFEFMGSYRDSSSSLTISIGADRRVELSSGAWAYPRPLLRDDDNNFHSTGYYSSSGCQVPVESYFDFDPNGQTLNVEFDLPQTIFVGPFGGCNFLGSDIRRHHLVKVDEQPGSSWSRQLEGRGCARIGAQNDLQRQFSVLQRQCQNQNGTSTTSINNSPVCTQPDPNDLNCAWGYCSVRGRFSCAITP